MIEFVVIAVIAATVLVLGVLLIRRGFYAERMRGAAEAARDAYRTKSEQARKANEIDEVVARLSDSDLDRELCDRR